MQEHKWARTGLEIRALSRVLNRVVLALVFFGMLALPIVWFGRASFAPATHENRRLEPFPKYSLYWFQSFEHWFSDRYGMRDALVYYGSQLQIARTGTPMNQDVVKGRDNWLFYDENYTLGQPHFASLYGKAPFSASDLQVIGGNLAQVRKHLAECGIPFYFVLAPDKQTIYPEKLWTPPPADAVTQADQLMTYLRTTDPELRVIDLRKPVKGAKASQMYELYKRTDTHWNTLGAFIGYQTIAKTLVHDGLLPDTPGANPASYKISRVPFKGGDIAVNLLDLPDYFEDYVVPFDPVEPRHAHEITLPGWPADIDDAFRVTENPAARGDLLLYRDSFAGELMPFFAEDFHHMYSFLGRKVDGERVRQAHPKVVMLQIVERSLRHLNEGPVNMEQACKP
ncbi:alginate O-acetyltransferase AlgX-related protein [Paraburkholderia saeva]|uniref:alginate O-acetyltransferase AlgX-related protein n=1 Tax=Paraburkholderia saeva TaxID=2777537 RepID=UPI001D43EE7C|nr:alginate O-acetyltransferase [Paraburkholderia saeva]CAG4907119.1 hypothetical protein R52603_03490 [Paraburkholderia saeva]